MALCFSRPDALSIASALGLPLLLPRRRGPVFLLCFPFRPFPCLLSALLTAIALRGPLRMEGLLTTLQQTLSRSRPTCRTSTSASLLISWIVCRTFRKAHGRYCSQKLMPRRGTRIPLRGAAVRSPTADATSNPLGANILYLKWLATWSRSREHREHGALRRKLDPHNGLPPSRH